MMAVNLIIKLFLTVSILMSLLEVRAISQRNCSVGRRTKIILLNVILNKTLYALRIFTIAYRIQTCAKVLAQIFVNTYSQQNTWRTVKNEA